MDQRTGQLIEAISEILKQEQFADIEGMVLKHTYSAVKMLRKKRDEKTPIKQFLKKRYKLNCLVNNIYSDLLYLNCMYREKCPNKFIIGEIKQFQQRIVGSLVLVKRPYKGSNTKIRESINDAIDMLISETEKTEEKLEEYVALAGNELKRQIAPQTIGALYQAQMARHQIVFSMNEGFNIIRDVHLKLAAESAILPVINSSINTIQQTFRLVSASIACINEAGPTAS